MKKYCSVILLLMTFISCDKNFDTLKIISSTPVNNSNGIAPDFYAEIEFNNDLNQSDIEDNFRISGSSDACNGLPSPSAINMDPVSASPQIAFVTPTRT